MCVLDPGLWVPFTVLFVRYASGFTDPRGSQTVALAVKGSWFLLTSAHRGCTSWVPSCPAYFGTVTMFHTGRLPRARQAWPWGGGQGGMNKEPQDL